MGFMGEDWERLARYVLNRRTSLRMTQEDVRTAGGPGTATMRLIEGALQTSYRPVILARLEHALEWAPGSIERILSGGEPTPNEDLPYMTLPGVIGQARLAPDSPQPNRPVQAILDLPIDDGMKRVLLATYTAMVEKVEAERRPSQSEHESYPERDAG